MNTKQTIRNTLRQAMKTTQPTFAAMQDWTQPQTVAASRLVILIAQANAAGFRAIGLAVLPSGYRVSFQRMDQPGTSRTSAGPSPCGRMLGSATAPFSCTQPTKTIFIL
jgi:hypothetical protein